MEFGDVVTNRSLVKDAGGFPGNGRVGEWRFVMQIGATVMVANPEAAVYTIFQSPALDDDPLTVVEPMSTRDRDGDWWTRGPDGLYDIHVDPLSYDFIRREYGA